MASLPQYHAHLMAHRYTLLCRFFGLHRVHLGGAIGRKVYFVVMGNGFPIDKPIHERYDLKGSTRNRMTSEEERGDPNVVLKDLDFLKSGRKLHLGPDKKRRLIAQVKKDCTLLERLEVIDYSLLVGIHRAAVSRQPSREKESSRFYKVASGTPKQAAASKARPVAGGGASTGGGRGGAGSGGERGGSHSAGPEEPEVGKEIYFVGCIDILCEYGLKKQLEHHNQAAKHGEKVGSQNFSVVDPQQYSTRFQNFISEAID